jgi:hypothetical protein
VKRDELGDAQAGSDHGEQERVIAASEPAGLVRRGEERVDLGFGEVGNVVAFVAFGWDLDHPCDRREMFGVAQRGVAVKRVDRREPGVAGSGTVAAVVFEVVQERADQRRVEVGEVQLAWLIAGLLLGEGEQQPERVAVGGDGSRARVSLGDQPVGEECLERRCELAHDSSIPVRSRRSRASASSSGDACRYQ